MAACVFAANQLGKQAGADGDIAVELPPQLGARCGGSLAELAASLGDLSAIVEEAKLFSQIGAAL
jgi:hypothetical protein